MRFCLPLVIALAVLAVTALLLGAGLPAPHRGFAPRDAGPRDQRRPDAVHDLYRISLDRVKIRPRPMPATQREW
jgi:hypothetical protein